MRNILDEIYSSKDLAPLLGFKGGTACYFLYHLPRFSTDLDFNLLNLSKQKQVFSILPDILNKYGNITDSHIKLNTTFFFLVHTKGKTGIKIEISIREIEKINNYELREFYGTSMLVMKKEDIFANKLIALKSRQAATSRDLYDINYFFKQNWDISEEIVNIVTGEKLLDYLAELPQYIKSNFTNATVHLGLGELVDTESQRAFIKTKLIDDTINQIKFYVDSKKRVS